MSDARRLVLATGNAHKVDEIRSILADFELEVTSLADYPGVVPGEETGDDFETNAAIKAESVSAATGCWALADDSGLEVKALGGRPGVHSKRYAGPEATDDDNNRRLLEELSTVPPAERQARFVSVLALARPGENTLLVRGEVRGNILDGPRGSGGFGYDPLFFYPPYERAFGELTLDQKNRISHRGAALTEMRERIRHLLNGTAAAAAMPTSDPGHPSQWTTPTRPGEAPLPVGRDFLRDPPPLVRTFEYIEAILIAIVLALILREFVVEAFKIPTPSMAPTLRGDPYGDRILVSKATYLLRDPHRWEVAVFRYPLDQTTNYIKRVVGLPGEKVEIVDGDIWINGQLERKSASVQSGLWIPLFPDNRDPYTAVSGEEHGAPGQFEANGKAVEGDAWQTDPAGGTRTLRYAFAPGAPVFGVSHAERRYEAGGGSSALRDLRLRGTVRLADASSTAAVMLRIRGAVYQVLFAADGVSVDFPRKRVLEADEPGKNRPVPVGEEVSVVVMHHDYTFVVTVDGEPWFRYTLEPVARIDLRGLPPTTLTLALGGAGGSWSRLGVDRDLHYTTGAHGAAHGGVYGVDVPADHFFMLGDNSENSKDSRRWRKKTVYLKDGRRIEYDHEQDPIHHFQRGLKIKDVLGNEYSTSDFDQSREAMTDDAPFVHRKLLIGRAFLIFFPWPPLHDGDFRPGFIR